MMDDSFTWAPDLIMNAIRRIFSLLDFVAYGLLQLVYRLFFSVASSDIFASDTIMKFYSRIQIILGVFMLFQLALIILKGIVNPDSFTDSKSGIGNLIMRICVALFLLTALVPISIPSPQNEYEIQLNNNGLLFGTLYSLQHRILENNTLGRLILGTNDESESNISVASQSDSLKKASRIFATTILKGFYRINLVPEENRTDKCKKAEDPAIYNECRMCQAGIDDYIDTYKKADASPDIIIGMVNETCTSDADLLTKFANFVAGTNRYIFTYTPVLSTITAVVFIFIFISFTIDVAVRAIKLAVLRLIAPIPIISYMDPKGSKDSAFNAWVKTLTSTYLDLFVRLAIVYFVLFLIQRIIQDGIVVGGTGIIKIFSYIAIFIGMFIFAKQAPKFIRQALGLKDSDFKLFGGMGAIVSAAGAVGSARAARQASEEADRAYARSQGMDEAATEAYVRANRGKHIAAAIAGGALGFNEGVTASTNAKDHSARAAINAINKRNANVLSAGRDGGTFLGGVSANARQLINGESDYAAAEAQRKAQEARIKDEELRLKHQQDLNAHRKSIMDRAKSKATDSAATRGSYTLNGVTYSGNYRAFHSAYEAAINNGTGVRTFYTDGAGNRINQAEYDALDATAQAACTQESWFEFEGQTINMAQAKDIDMGLYDANTANFYEQVVEYEQTGGVSGINDASILADRAAYREGTVDEHNPNGVDLEAVYDTAGGLKATYGSHANENNATSDRLNREREAINNSRRSYESQRDQANANRFNGGNGK